MKTYKDIQFDFKTEEELQDRINENKPEKVLRTFWLKNEQRKAYKDLINTSKEEYHSIYPDFDRQGQFILYAEYIDEVESQEGDLEKIYPKNYYNEDGTLKDEWQELIDKGQVRPILDYYLWKIVDEWRLPELDEQEYLKFIKPVMKNKVQILADDKTTKAETAIAGKDITDKQDKRYRTKYDKAIEAKNNNDYSKFELEASLSIPPISAEDLVNVIIAKGTSWLDALADFIYLIEAYRVASQNRIDLVTTLECIEKAQELLNKAKDMDENTSEDDIKALFTEFDECLKL